MPEQEKDAHLSALEACDFGRAKELYGTLLSSDPDNVEYLCGFYTAGYWANRADVKARKRPGRALASWLTSEWDLYQGAAHERDFTGALSFRAAMRGILKEAADNFRTAFQEEGAGPVDPTLLLELGRCLIRVEDYRNAVEVLHYARRVAGPGAQVLFLLGEALCAQGQAESLENGLGCLRDSFLLEPKVFDPSLVASDPAASVFRELHDRKDQRLEETIDWFPAHLMARSMLPGLRRLTETELDTIASDADRLTRDLGVVVDKFKDKVRSRVGFYCLVLIHYYSFHDKNTTLSGQWEEKLRTAAPELYTYYKDSRPKR